MAACQTAERNGLGLVALREEFVAQALLHGALPACVLRCPVSKRNRTVSARYPPFAHFVRDVLPQVAARQRNVRAANSLPMTIQARRCRSR